VLSEHVLEMVPQDMLCVDGKVLLGELREEINEKLEL
jgi:hypothetical protein